MSSKRTRAIAFSATAFTAAALLAASPTAQADTPSSPAATSSANTRTPHQVTDINATVSQTSPERAARAYLADHTATFGIVDSDVSLIDTASSQGRQTARFQQKVHGVPVLGANYLVHMQRHGDSTTILSANGDYFTGLQVDTAPTATADEASTQARNYVAQLLANGKLTATKAPAMTTDPKGLVVVPSGRGTLAYDIQVTTAGADGSPVIKNVYVDATTAWPLFALDAVQTDSPVVGSGVLANGQSTPLQLTKTDAGQYLFLDQSRSNTTTKIRTYDGRKYDVSQVLGVMPKDAAVYGGSSDHFAGEPTDAGLVDAHVNAGHVYDFYRALGRDGLDGKGGDINSIVGVTSYGKPYVNAFWDGSKMVYGGGDAEYRPMSSELDVVGHEMTHGVIEHTSNLLYANQSGAMNEGLADYFGNAIEDNVSGISLDDPKASLMGENLCRTLSPEECALRDLEDHRTTASYQGLTLPYDNGGVHENSTIFSGALWDIRKALGPDIADPLIYKAMTEYMTPLDDFVAGRDAVVLAAKDTHVGSFGMGAIVSAFNKHGIKPGWTQHAGDATRLLDNVMAERTGPAAAGGWWVQSQSTPEGNQPYAIYSGRTDGSGAPIKLSDPLPDRNPNAPKRYNVLPATDGKNAVWFAWGSSDARIMVAPVDGSAPAVEVGGTTNASNLSIDGDWVSWTSVHYGIPKQYYLNIKHPGSQQMVDPTYYKYSGYGAVKDGKLYYLLNWPDAKGIHLNIVIRDLATGSETMVPEFLPKDGYTTPGLFAPKVISNKIVVGVDQYPGQSAGLWKLDLDGSNPQEVLPETSKNAPILGNYDATDQAVTFENWPGDVPPKIEQIGIDGGAIHPMSCSTGVQYMVNADEGTRAVWLDGSYGGTSLVVRDKPREHC